MTILTTLQKLFEEAELPSVLVHSKVFLDGSRLIESPVVGFLKEGPYDNTDPL